MTFISSVSQYTGGLTIIYKYSSIVLSDAMGTRDSVSLDFP